MQERLLHFIWQNKLFNTKELKTVNGKEIQILDFGKYNKDGGPDFWNAKVKIEDVILVGNIELHIYASDWKRHKHQYDRKYNNVILHVVYFNDDEALQLPTIQLNGRIPVILLEKYESMMLSKQELICEHMLDGIDSFTLENWKERLMIERLERKSDEILVSLKEHNNDWEQTCYRLLGKYFGSHINKEPFETITRLLDYKIVLKHANDIFQIEALLFGVAGLLNKDFVETYPRELKAEYQFLKQKYSLLQLQEHQWQFLRMRPVSFPTIRLAWFAKVVQQMPLLTKILMMKDEDFFIDNIEVSDYWNQHYIFDKLSKLKSKSIGDDFKSIIKINVVAPLLYAYGKSCGEEKYKDKAFDVLYKSTGEENNKTKKYTNQIWQKNTSFDTQAIIELNDNYCAGKRCLECAIGHKILRNDNKELLANNC